MNENKMNINWLSCIYGVHHLNLYKMGVFKNWDLARFNKKVRKIIKNKLKYTCFWEELGLLACNMPTNLILIKRGDIMYIWTGLVFNKKKGRIHKKYM